MSRNCTICIHMNRLQIDRALAQGQSIPKISKEFNVAEHSLRNHRDNHLSRQLLQAMSKKEVMEGMNILNDIEDLITRTKNILDMAEDKKRYGLALGAIREVRGSYELLSKIAFTMHQARLSELEAEKLKAGIWYDEENMKRTHDMIAKLNPAEKDMLKRLNLKMLSDDWRDMVVIPDEPDEFADVSELDEEPIQSIDPEQDNSLQQSSDGGTPVKRTRWPAKKENEEKMTIKSLPSHVIPGSEGLTVPDRSVSERDRRRTGYDFSSGRPVEEQGGGTSIPFSHPEPDADPFEREYLDE